MSGNHATRPARSPSDTRAFLSYARALPGFIRRRVGPEESRSWMTRELARREENFIAQLRDAVYGNPRSPYRPLLEWAGLELGDVIRLVADSGLESALDRLFDAGVHVTLEELKGRRPIERPGLSLPVRPADFDNPLVGAAVAASTGGTRGRAQPVKIDIDLLEYEISSEWLLTETHGDIDGRPVAYWRPILAGLKEPLRYSKRGIRVERWFALTELKLRRGLARRSLTTLYTLLASRVWGTPIPFPEYVPAREAATVARWLAFKVGQGTPALMNSNASSAVRVCLAARAENLNIEGTVFRVGGEPFTEAKASILAERGCRAIVNYAITEIGRVGASCADPQALDDVHVALDKLAVIQRNLPVGAGGQQADVFLFTTLHPRARKILLNVDTGDYGVLERRRCACLMGEIGLDQHIHTIRSYEKLTSEGVTFIGTDLIRLIEEILPQRFGGAPTDYQLVEREVDGLTKVELVVSPRVGPLDEDVVLEAVLHALERRLRGGTMATIWRSGETLRIVRREPHLTGSAKVQPLHVLRA